MKPTNNKVPKHLAIILDGNRRFAKRLMMKPFKGHEWGAKKIEKLLDWCKEFKIKELTLYAFSVENFNRPKEEFNYLMNVFKKEFDRLKSDERLEKEKIKINFIGRIKMFPKEIQEKMSQLMEKTKDNNKFLINFAMAYGGRQEIIDGVKELAAYVKHRNMDVYKINEKMFSNFLYMKDEPDLIIRTGGEKRMSNFLMWQSPYSELIFLEKMWPEFDKKDFIQCIEEYNRRERRFGR